jgi:hypothetical protein
MEIKKQELARFILAGYSFSIPPNAIYTRTATDNDYEEINLYFSLEENEISFSITEFSDQRSAKDIIEQIYYVNNELMASKFNLPVEPIPQKNAWTCRYLLYENQDHVYLISLAIIEFEDKKVELKYSNSPENFSKGEEIFTDFVASFVAGK